jgi:hypothetical protein
LTSLMLLVHDGYLLLAVATSSNTPAGFRRTSLCLYIRPSFFPPPLLPRELLRLYSPYENPVPGYRPSCDGGTWWPSPVLQVTTRQVRNFFGESEAMNSWLLDKIHIDREPLANYYVRITRGEIPRTKFQVYAS